MRHIIAIIVLCQIFSATLSYAMKPTEPPGLAASSDQLGPLDAAEPLPRSDAPEQATANPSVDPAVVLTLDRLEGQGSSQKGPTGTSSTIERLLEHAMSQNLIAGGVAVVGNHSGILSTTARGHLNGNPASPPISERTIFDLASLTKVIATTPAVMKLLDEGRISVSDPLSRWFPEFSGSGHDEITVLNLLTHTSGLSDVMVGSDRSMETVVRKAAAQNYRQHLGREFSYADINFILLGELVRRVSGETLDVFCQTQIYRPLGIPETMFLPPRNLAEIAPTSGADCGIVQDPNARRLGGVAGHAGLFSSAYDLSRFARMILGGGMLDNQRILSERVVAQMTSPNFANGGSVMRGLGWDMQSPYSAPKGSYFSQSSFGHTGYSGSSIWIDPSQDLFVILLTNRVNYRDVHNFNQLRRDVSTVAAIDFRAPGSAGPAASLEMAKVNADVLRDVTRLVRSEPVRIKLVSLSQHKWQHQQRARRQQCSTRKLPGRHAVAHHRGARASKAMISAKKRRSMGRRA